MAKVFVFRHGQTEDNLNHTFSGFRQSDLTDAGIQEAKDIGERLKSQKVNKAYQSDLIRSQHTLQLVLDGFHDNVKIITDPRIKERNYGDLTGKNKDEVKKENPKQYELWHRAYDTPPPNGESIEMVQIRVLNFLNEQVLTWKKDYIIFISAHGNSIRPIRRYFENLSIEQMCGYENTPGKIYEYEI